MTVVKDVVAEEDRNRNVMIFGLSEDPNEQLNIKCSEILLELGENLTARSVKITVKSSSVVQQILITASNLRNSDHFIKRFNGHGLSGPQTFLNQFDLLSLFF